MGDGDTYTTRCRGRENYSAHCVNNGPSSAVFVEIIAAAWIIFGLFCCYVRWSGRRRQLEWIEWNSDSSDAGSTEQGYFHMHPDLNKPRKTDRRGANSWLAKISSRSLKSELSSFYHGRQGSEAEPIPKSEQGSVSQGDKIDEEQVISQTNGESSGQTAISNLPP